MAITKERKEELIAEYVEQLKRSKGLILADYRGLTVSDVDKLRHTMRPIGGKFQVVKNRLLKLALAQVGMAVPDEWLEGATAASFCFDEVPPVVKALADMIKESEKLSFKGGLVGSSLVMADQVRPIADLPSREVLLAQVLGTINAPASQVAGVVTGGIRQVLNVLQAYVDKLQEASGGASGAAAEQAAY